MKPDYYAVLGVAPEASERDVKAAFRKKAKLLHPDLAKQGLDANDSGSGEAMRSLLEAYRVLADPVRRREYDKASWRIRREPAKSAEFDYRAFLKGRPLDLESQARLVIYDLLHGLEEEALEVYERHKIDEKFRLERFFEREEAMDAEYCIAEEYEKRGRYLKAYLSYMRLIRMENEKPAFRYFFPVVTANFRRLILVSLHKAMDEEDYLDRLDEASSLPLPAAERAFFLRRKAEILARGGRFSEAREAAEAAIALAPKLSGLKAILARSLVASRLPSA